jgi:hypothetical protein
MNVPAIDGSASVVIEISTEALLVSGFGSK